MQTESFCFKQKERLKTRGDIRKVFNTGKVVRCPGAKLLVLKNNLPFNRIVFTFSHKFGNAVERNRARRLGREAYRHIKHTVNTGYDMVLLVYPGTDSFILRQEQLITLLNRAGLC